MVPLAWQHFVLKIAALLTFCGGPLVLADALAPHLPAPWGFAAAFAPVALLTLGSLCLLDGLESRADRWAVQAGRVGAWLIVGVDLWGLRELRLGPPRDDVGLIVLGITLGLPTCLYYLYQAGRLLRSEEEG